MSKYLSAIYQITLTIQHLCIKNFKTSFLPDTRISLCFLIFAMDHLNASQAWKLNNWHSDKQDGTVKLRVTSVLSMNMECTHLSLVLAPTFLEWLSELWIWHIHFRQRYPFSHTDLRVSSPYIIHMAHESMVTSCTN